MEKLLTIPYLLGVIFRRIRAFAAIFLVYIAIAVLGWLELAPVYLKNHMVTGLLIFFTYTLYILFFELRQANFFDVLRWVERKNNLTAGELIALRDKPVNKNVDSNILWKRFAVDKSDEQSNFLSLRLFYPEGFLKSHANKFFMASLMIFVISLFFSINHDRANLIISSLEIKKVERNSNGGGVNQPNINSFSIRLFYPDYLDKKPIIISAQSDKAIQVLYGSRIEIKENDSRYSLTFSGCNIKNFSGILEEDCKLKIKSGLFSKVAELNFQVIQDERPKIAFTGNIESSNHHILKIPTSVSDDYGINSLKAYIVLQTRDSALPFCRAPDVIEVPIAESSKAINEDIRLNLSRYRLSGKEVGIYLEAMDGAGGYATTEQIIIQMPEIEFSNPFSKKMQAFYNSLTKQSANYQNIATRLKLLSKMPDEYYYDIKLYLGINAAANRLFKIPTGDSVDDVLNIIWDMAIYAEKGNSEDVINGLEKSIERLIKALEEENYNKENVEQLLAEFAKNLSEVLKAVGANSSNMDISHANQSELDVSDVLSSIKDMIDTGAKKEAVDILKEMMKSIEGAQTLSEEQSKAMQEARKEINKIQTLLERQRQLLDETILKEIDKKGDYSEQSNTQRNILSETKALSLKNEAKDQAMKFMQDSVVNLESVNPNESARNQRDAINSLSGLLEQAKKQFNQQFGNVLNLGGLGGKKQDSGNNNGGKIGSDINIPKQNEINRSRMILEKLYQRSNNPQNDVDEHYMRRLLEF